MGFTVENKITNEKYAVVMFVFSDPFTYNDMTKVLNILTALLASSKPFAFYIDSRNTSSPPLNTAPTLIKWLKFNKTLFKQYLICSSIVMGNSMSTGILTSLLNGVFTLQPPVSPNKLSTDIKVTETWIEEKVNDYFKKIQK